MSIAYVSGDVSRDETLLSYKIADMSIAYVSRDVSRDTAHIYAHI